MFDTQPKNEEIRFADNDIIVSKTDLKGRITYANDIFCNVAEVSPADIVGQPHSVIRHPDMPRVIFKTLWDTLLSGKEIFAYVKNMSSTGKYYWVYAHVTPSYDTNGVNVGFHSNRRVPNRAALSHVEALYRDLKAVEDSVTNRKIGLEKSTEYLHNFLDQKGVTYDQLIWALETGNV